MDLDSFGIKLQTVFLVDQEALYILSLIALELYHFSHLTVADDGTITSELLADHFEDLLLVEFGGEALDCG